MSVEGRQARERGGRKRCRENVRKGLGSVLWKVVCNKLRRRTPLCDPPRGTNMTAGEVLFGLKKKTWLWSKG